LTKRAFKSVLKGVLTRFNAYGEIIIAQRLIDCDNNSLAGKAVVSPKKTSEERFIISTLLNQTHEKNIKTLKLNNNFFYSSDFIWPSHFN
jgi:hypothetical protein